MELEFNTTDGVIRVPSDAVLVFVDETGHEKLADRKYPIFGLGGCVVRADQYLATVHNPWTAMKLRFFLGRSGPLHATGLRPTPAQAAAIAEVFTQGHFGRIATVLSDRTVINISNTRYQITVASLLKRFDTIAPTFWPFSRTYFIHEASDRANRLAVKFFGPFTNTTVEGEDGSPIQLPVTHIFADKNAGLVGLELADFIMHAAGKCVHAGGPGSQGARARRDFQAVFGSVPASLSSFLEINDVKPGMST